MKKFFNYIVYVIFAVIALSFVACKGKDNDNTIIDQYEGKWYCYKTVASGETIDFRDFPTVLAIELSIEISTNKTYVCHYYVGDNEGKEYPKEGTYSVSGNTLLLTGDMSGRAEISGTEMIITLDGVTQYYQRNSYLGK